MPVSVPGGFRAFPTDSDQLAGRFAASGIFSPALPGKGHSTQHLSNDTPRRRADVLKTASPLALHVPLLAGNSMEQAGCDSRREIPNNRWGHA